MDEKDFRNVLDFLNRTMREEGKSERTIEKYQRDIRSYLGYVCRACECSGKREQDCTEADTDRVRKTCRKWYQKSSIQSYRRFLGETYKTASANSKIAALNYYFRISGLPELRVRQYRIQNSVFRSGDKELTREEYFRLLQAAEDAGKVRLYMIMQTIAATGLRISELPFVTVKSIADQYLCVTLKGKTRIVLLPHSLCEKLHEYIHVHGIVQGSVFVTRNGKPVDRSNIVHEMKKLGKEAGVARKKLFPHNLRHLFAVTYYQSEKDIFHLADILGHSNINTTRIYTSIGFKEHLKQIEKLGLLK